MHIMFSKQNIAISRFVYHYYSNCRVDVLARASQLESIKFYCHLYIFALFLFSFQMKYGHCLASFRLTSKFTIQLTIELRKKTWATFPFFILHKHWWIYSKTKYIASLSKIKKIVCFRFCFNKFNHQSW